MMEVYELEDRLKRLSCAQKQSAVIKEANQFYSEMIKINIDELKLLTLKESQLYMALNLEPKYRDPEIVRVLTYIVCNNAAFTLEEAIDIYEKSKATHN